MPYRVNIRCVCNIFGPSYSFPVHSDINNRIALYGKCLEFEKIGYEHSAVSNINFFTTWMGVIDKHPLEIYI